MRDIFYHSHFKKETLRLERGNNLVKAPQLINGKAGSPTQTVYDGINADLILPHFISFA